VPVFMSEYFMLHTPLWMCGLFLKRRLTHGNTQLFTIQGFLLHQLACFACTINFDFFQKIIIRLGSMIKRCAHDNGSLGHSESKACFCVLSRACVNAPGYAGSNKITNDIGALFAKLSCNAIAPCDFDQELVTRTAVA